MNGIEIFAFGTGCFIFGMIFGGLLCVGGIEERPSAPTGPRPPPPPNPPPAPARRVHMTIERRP